MGCLQERELCGCTGSLRSVFTAILWPQNCSSWAEGVGQLVVNLLSVHKALVLIPSSRCHRPVNLVLGRWEKEGQKLRVLLAAEQVQGRVRFLRLCLHSKGREGLKV